MLLSLDETTPCGDGVFKGVKVAWPGSGGQREEFPLGRVRSIRTSCIFAHIHTRTDARSRVCLLWCAAAWPRCISLLHQRVILARPRRFICPFGSLTRRFVADRDEASCFRSAAATAAADAIAATSDVSGTVWHNYLFVAPKWSAVINHPQFTRHNHKSSGRTNICWLWAREYALSDALYLFTLPSEFVHYIFNI